MLVLISAITQNLLGTSLYNSASGIWDAFIGSLVSFQWFEDRSV